MTVLIFIIMLVVLIVAHEFGHFIVAKLSGMKVPEFGLGFPPKLWGKKIGDTEYTINALPFGGFVKIEGEDPKEADTDPAAFSNRPKVLQAATLLAGPFGNIILAFVLFFFAFMAGVPSVVEEGQGDLADARVVIVNVLPESPAESAGLRAGDRVIALRTDGRETAIEMPETLSSQIAASEGELTVIVERGGEQREITAMPTMGLIEEAPEKKALGIASALVGTLRMNPLDAFVAALTETGEKTVMVVVGLFALIGSALTLSADVGNVAGPVGIASLTGEAAQFGVGALLSFAALISINLGILNLLPFPALDGGRLAFLAVEAVTRRPIPASFANAVNTVGFAILILLMLAVTAQDIVRLVT